MDDKARAARAWTRRLKSGITLSQWMMPHDRHELVCTATICYGIYIKDSQIWLEMMLQAEERISQSQLLKFTRSYKLSEILADPILAKYRQYRESCLKSKLLHAIQQNIRTYRNIPIAFVPNFYGEHWKAQATKTTHSGYWVPFAKLRLTRLTRLKYDHSGSGNG